jgi:hypothetical protein
MTMGDQDVTEGKKSPETVVSVRFTTDEVGQLKQLAESRGLTLSAVIRRAALAVFGTPTRLVMPSINQGASGSAWMAYDWWNSQMRVGSTVIPTASVVSQIKPTVNTP